MIPWRRILQSSDWQYLAMVIPLMVLFQAIGPEYLRYQQNAVADGQWWRILSAHWVHVGWMHLLLNSLSLVVCVSLTAPGWSLRRWLLVTVSMGLGISFLLMLNNPEVTDYAGHSGLLYGLYVLGGIGLYPRDRLISVLVVAAILVKILMEQFSFYDFNTGSLIGARVIVDAHFYGVLMAIAIALLWATYTIIPGSREHSN
jgi:rhomboid family GlyGly-CTERM serine protease